MTNAATYSRNFARVLESSARTVDLAYDLDRAIWPWLGLPAAHPVLVEKYQYFGSVTASWHQGIFTPETFTALTQFSWECLPGILAGQYPTRGRFEYSPDEEAMGFELTLAGEQGQPLVNTRGQGATFQDRDYQQWRARTRDQALAQANKYAARDVQACSAASVGLAQGGRSFLSRGAGNDAMQARVPSNGGFAPQHPFHTGSGGHVNAAQLLDCGLQAIHYHLGQGRAWREPLTCVGGSAHFQRYVELDIPFSIEVRAESDNETFTLALSQAGRDNAALVLKMQRDEMQSPGPIA